MKKILLSSSVILALLVSQLAFADSRHHRRSYGHGHSNSYSYGYNRHQSNWVNSYHYGSSSRRHGYSYGYRYDDHHSGHHYDSGSFFGGLVLGSILSYPARKPQTIVYASPPVVRTQEVVTVTQTRPTTTITTGRSLLIDLQGNCFERNVDENGNEIRVQLDPSECSF